MDDYSLVAFLPLNIKDEDSVSDVLVQVDNAIQYGEDLDVREAKVRLNQNFHRCRDLFRVIK